MKATELQLNDLVLDQYCKVARVTSMSETMIVTISVTEKDGPVTLSRPEQVQPIGLTEDILVKNRFALDKSLAEIGMKVYTRSCPAGDLSVKVFHDGSIRFGFIKLTYVHQLQHLLRLAGVQKEIEL
jgi:hypothetical protein